MSELFLGIDLGGSGLRSGLVNTGGTKILNLPETNFEPGSLNNDKLTRLLVEKIKSAINVKIGKDITAIGIGSPGPLNPVTGIIECPPNLKVNSFPVIEIIGKYFARIPAFLLNDADASLLGEAWKGVAQGFENVVMLTLGTGVGSGVIAGGKLQRGRGKGAEWGHATIYASGERRLCGCGNLNCLEAFVGTEGLVKNYCRIFKVPREIISAIVVRHFLIEFADVVNSKEERNNFHKVADSYCLHLVEGIRNIVCVHHPECVVLGGGIIQHNRYLFNRVKELLSETNNGMASLMKGTKIGLAKFERPGVIGAAKHAIDCYEAIVEQHRADHGIVS